MKTHINFENYTDSGLCSYIFIDISNCEEGTFRISRHHEHSHSISDICNLGK